MLIPFLRCPSSAGATLSRRQLLLRLLFPLLAIIACGGVEPHPPVHLTLAGSTSMLPLVQELARAYEEAHHYATIDTKGGGSRFGLEAVRKDQVEIGMISWDLTGGEASGLRARTIAYDGLTIIVNEDNRVRRLALAEIRNIFTGQILDWSELGGEAGEIQVVSREDGSGTREVFEVQVMQGKRVIPMAVIMPGSQAVVEFVATHPTAIGYVSMGWLGEGVRAVAVEGIEPNRETVAQERYPLTRPLLLVTPNEPDPEAQSFINFVLSPRGQAIVTKKYVGVREK